MKLHFVGIGGIGTSGLAQLCAHLGHDITGSNLGSNPILKKLQSLDFSNLYDTHNANNLSADTDLLIYSEAVPPENPEREKARDLGIQEKSYFEYLGEISKSYQTIAVAGTHGKTTTTGLITAGFQNTHFDATVLVGSTLDILEGSNFKAGSNKFLVAEACEYRDNFKFLKPDVLIITNLEWDHADYYKSEADYYAAFKRLAQNSKNVLYHQNDEAVRTMLEGIQTNKLPIPAQSPNSWDAILNIWGEANQQNATLALALGHFLALDLETFKIGLGQYKGAGRRQELVGEMDGIKVFDDYGHHPTEIKATIQAFRARFPHSKIGLIYEPHQYSRTHQFFAEFAQSFKHADYTALFPIYEARDTETDKAAVSIQDFVEDNPALKLVSNLEEAQKFASLLNKGDLLLFMGAGKISQFAHKFITD
jgi:UDP-N-acetylmuramate--alanine ligase